MTAAELHEADRLMEAVSRLQGEITGVDLISTWVRRRIQPLQARQHPMWEYSGPADPTRIGQEELSNSEVATHVQLLSKERDDDVCAR